jgi:endonuclease YncB( thermonuclease family)
MAERYRGKTKRIDKEKYDAAEAKAKSSKLGIWSMKNYVSPQDWRRESKK